MSTIISGDTGVSQCQPNSISQDDLQTGVVGKGPVGEYYSSAAVISNNTMVKLNLDLASIDTNTSLSAIDSRIIPSIAGYYQFTCVVNAITTSTTLETSLRKNGGVVITKSNPQCYEMSVTQVVFMNGTTDYIEIWGQSSTNQGVTARVSMAMVRAA